MSIHQRAYHLSASCQELLQSLDKYSNRLRGRYSNCQFHERLIHRLPSSPFSLPSLPLLSSPLSPPSPLLPLLSPLSSLPSLLHKAVTNHELLMGEHLNVWSETEYTNAGEVMQKVGKLQQQDAKAR